MSRLSLGCTPTSHVVWTVGVLLHFQGLRSLFALAAVVCAIKLILKPVMVWLPYLALEMTATQTQVQVLEAAMPSALLTVVLVSS